MKRVRSASPSPSPAAPPPLFSVEEISAGSSTDECSSSCEPEDRRAAFRLETARNLGAALAGCAQGLAELVARRDGQSVPARYEAMHRQLDQMDRMIDTMTQIVEMEAAANPDL